MQAHHITIFWSVILIQGFKNWKIDLECLHKPFVFWKSFWSRQASFQFQISMNKDKACFNIWPTKYSWTKLSFRETFYRSSTFWRIFQLIRNFSLLQDEKWKVSGCKTFCFFWIFRFWAFLSSCCFWTTSETSFSLLFQ